MAWELTPEAMTRYRATAQRRWEKEQQEGARRLQRAWGLVRQAAALLKDEFGAIRVVVFGSLVQGHRFSQTSDIDLAAWGLKGEDFFLAVARLQDLSPEFEVDLVAVEHCKPELRKVILEEGIPV